MAEKMKAIRKVRPEKGLVIEEIPLPQVGLHDVLVRIEAASICGTDLHIWEWNEWAQRRLKLPLTIGHEFAGTVVEVGPKVETIKPGDFVSAESHVTCGLCYCCRTGQAHMCPETRILGVDREGSFADYISVPESVIWKNDRAKLTPEVASVQEPFGNAVFATLAHELVGQTMCILGCGPIGLFAVAIAKGAGARPIYATDINDYRLHLASQVGATATFNPRTAAKGMDTAKWVLDQTGGIGVDIVMEMSGAASAIQAAFDIVRKGGKVTLFGIPAKPVELDVAERMIFKNLTILALNGRQIFETWYRTRTLLEKGLADIRPLITNIMPFAQYEEAMRLLHAGQACKIVLKP